LETAKMSTDDLKAHAASNQDFYALLDLSPSATESEIRRGYRKTALKYHPDKIANPTPADIDKFHLLQIANDVLSDASIRQLYDNAREARLRKQREREQMGAAKRKMREDLEAAERAGAAAAADQRGVKRSWASADDDAEVKLQREIERIAEDGRRRRREAGDKLRRELEEEEQKAQAEEEEARKVADRGSQRVDRSQDGGANVPELDRTIKVRWEREALDLDSERLKALFGPFGKVEGTFMLKDKRKRVEGKREKVTLATGAVVFESIVGAHAAVVDSEKKRRQSGVPDGDWAHIESVEWASGSPPEFNHGVTSQKAADTAPPKQNTPPEQQNPAPSATQDTKTSERPAKPAFSFPGVNSGAPKSHKTPSFGSFASAATSGKGMPSFQETVMMRLKNAQREKERKALEEELAKEDEAADANGSK
jgi:DnaJ family protein C protein 17